MFEIHDLKLEDGSYQGRIRVYLPKTYHKYKKKSFPVFYMHDGQNLFNRDSSSYGQIWAAHTVVDKMLKSRRFKGCILVGIDHPKGEDRLKYMTPWPSENPSEIGLEEIIGGQCQSYVRFIVECVKPFIDSTYRTLSDRANTLIGGSSIGGLTSLYMQVRYPDIFSKVMGMSTTSWFSPQALRTCLESYDPHYKSRWYLDVGGKEVESIAFTQKYISGAQALVESLKRAGVEEEDIEFIFDKEGVHNEMSWSRRLPYALKWLLDG